MLKEMAQLMFVLWCTQGLPTPPAPMKYPPTLDRLRCDAESLFENYANDKFFPPEMRPTIEANVSGPNCNFTKAPKEAEICDIIQAFHELLDRVNKTHHDDQLLEPLMAKNRFSSAIDYQGNYLKSNCPQLAQIRAPITYQNTKHEPTKENIFYYIFEQYKYCTYNLLRQLKPDAKISDACKDKQ